MRTMNDLLDTLTKQYMESAMKAVVERQRIMGKGPVARWWLRPVTLSAEIYIAWCADQVILYQSQKQSGLCTLGVGCEETGMCYAMAHGDPTKCGKLGVTNG
jgi:hypothetical protein